MLELPKQPTVPPMPNINKNKNLEYRFELDDNCIYRVTPLDDKGTYMSYVVMDKETFIKAFERWVKNE